MLLQNSDNIILLNTDVSSKLCLCIVFYEKHTIVKSNIPVCAQPKVRTPKMCPPKVKSISPESEFYQIDTPRKGKNQIDTPRKQFIQIDTFMLICNTDVGH